MSAGEAANQPDAEDRKKEQGWRTFFSPTNPNLWILIAVITAVIALVDLPLLSILSSFYQHTLRCSNARIPLHAHLLRDGTAEMQYSRFLPKPRAGSWTNCHTASSSTI